MAAAIGLPDLTRTEDFLEWVWRQPHKHEVIEGRLVMMAGGTNPHATIAVNLVAELRTALRGKRCRAFNSDFLVEVSGRNRYYPDASVACDEQRNWTDRPVLIVEVLSPSTKREDLGPKLRNYLRIPGITAILYLWQDEPRARLWLPPRPSVDITRLDAAIELPELGVSLAMAELYRDVFAA